MKKSQSKLDERNPNQKKTKTRLYHPFDKYIGKYKLDDTEAYKKIDEIYLKD